ncbi:hypothetical protein HanRHA438_Chr09g0428531 [Helianthus annuus]|nr:hypothetical protein HanRHA438_Chr09g0428531 [Helianthus annuus]
MFRMTGNHRSLSLSERPKRTTTVAGLESISDYLSLSLSLGTTKNCDGRRLVDNFVDFC